jgi:NAD(P)-dependent dehydrogenase (short-subunit alcohol dehydrogenase family)
VTAAGAERIALVTGANRGIGLGVVRGLAERGYLTILGARDLARGEAAAAELAREQLSVLPRQLDVTDQSSIDRLAHELGQRHGHLDVLVNNAAIDYDTWQAALNADLQVVREAMETNVYGPWRMVQTFLPLLEASRRGRIVNVSSEGGSLASMGGGTPAYSLSKAALNALTRMLAAELSRRRPRILVNAVCPGWVATDMGGPGGRPIAEGAASVLWAVDLPDDGPSGGFFRDGQPLPW